MASIKNIDLAVRDVPAKAHAKVTVNFSAKEQELGLEYMLWVTLYDQDLGRDEEWLYPNFPYIPSDTWASHDKDDWIAHMPGKRLRATQSEVVVDLSTPLAKSDNRGNIEPISSASNALANDTERDANIELYARAIVLPETSYAVRYSRSQPVSIAQLEIPS